MIVRVKDWAWFPVNEYPPDFLKVLQQKLTLFPKKTSEHQRVDDLPPLRQYDLQDGMFGIPRAFFLKNNSGKYEVSDERSFGHPVDLLFNGSLTEDQVDAVKAYCMSQGGIIQARPGWGKTVVALSIWNALRVSAVVVVDKSFLLNQWIERIKSFIPDARIGIIQKDICEFGDEYDISIAMIQSLVKRKEKYPKEFWNSFGLVINDEIHRIGAPLWSQVAPAFTARYRLGISATPRRRDGMDSVFLWHIGNVVYKSKVNKVIPKLRRIFTDFKFVSLPKFDPNKASKEIQLRFLCKNPKRNRLIVNELKSAVSMGRKVLIMSERRKHLEWIKELFEEIKPVDCVVDYYVGGMKQASLDVSAKANVILSTYQMAKEALDIPDVDTLFLTTPVADVEQPVGRIMRECEGKKKPVVTDFIDFGVGRFRYLWEARLKFYEREGIFNGQKTND
jgi:superfamily II DNA or RNA helicase